MQNIVLNVQNIEKSYGKTPVLKGVSFKLTQGEKKALIGVNGSGKSTLIEIICGVKKESTGSVDGIINDCKNFGYMCQSFSLFADLTVRGNLEYFALIYGVDKSRIDEVINMCFLTEKQNYLCCNLSGGYKQLTSLAVAILHKPKLLILDEPTSAMDPLFRDKFWKIIDLYSALGNAILIITHYIEEVEKCDSIMVLSDGKIIFDKSVQETFKEGQKLSIAELIIKAGGKDE